MRLSFEHSWQSITESVIDTDMESLAIVTGLNGSGKSQLIGAIAAGALRCDGFPTGPSTGEVRMYGMTELMKDAEQPQLVSDLRDRWLEVAMRIEGIAGHSRNSAHGTARELENMIIQNIRGNKLLSEGSIKQLLAYSEKKIQDYTRQEIKNALPMQYKPLDPFVVSIVNIFGTYFAREDDNTYQQFRSEKGRPHKGYLPDDEFRAKYGPPPWNTVNDALALIHLPYHFLPPTDIEDIANYQPQLKHNEEDLVLSPESLSTGERTLLTIALSLYSSNEYEHEFFTLPRVLLLDEPDASLHPSMIASLLNVIEQIFVTRLGMYVIMTSHSPTTVALAPERCLYTMHRGTGRRLVKVSTDQALSALTVGLPTLSVSVDDRRTVIVEEKDDVASFEKLYMRLKSELPSSHSLQFIASGSGTPAHSENSGSCQEVRRLVSSLRSSGNDRIFGIVDRDINNGESSWIKIASERYSIENYLLDPHLIFQMLMMNNMVPDKESVVGRSVLHFELAPRDSPAIVNYIANALDFDGEERRESRYFGGFTATIPESFFEMNGHALEARYKQKIPAINKFRPSLKNAVLDFAIRDQTDFIPHSLFDLLYRLNSN